MKKSLFALGVMTTATALAGTETVNFDNMKTGAAPAGWTATQTSSGKAKWTVENDGSAPSKPNVLKQSGQATFPICFKNDTNIKDGFVEVTFDGKKAIEWDDDTFKDVGKVGVWTKADSVTEFDDFSYASK